VYHDGIIQSRSEDNNSNLTIYKPGETITFVALDFTPQNTGDFSTFTLRFKPAIDIPALNMSD